MWITWFAGGAAVVGAILGVYFLRGQFSTSAGLMTLLLMSGAAAASAVLAWRTNSGRAAMSPRQRKPPENLGLRLAIRLVPAVIALVAALIIVVSR